MSTLSNSMIDQSQDNHKDLKERKNQDEKSKKKVSLIKKKVKPTIWNKLYHNIDVKHVININDLVFINENALKDPENSESLMSAIFYYKMISKVAINEDYIAISLKKLDENALPPEYYLERLRSYGDAKYNNIANYLENLKRQFAHFDETEKNKQQVNFKKQNFIFQEELKMLDDQVKLRKGKMYLIFFCQICPNGVMLKKIVISSELLRQLGYNVNQIALDFIKHKHIFFEIFTAKMYSTMIQASLGKYAQMTNSLMQQQPANQQLKQDDFIIYQDQMIRKRTVNGNYQEDLLSVRVKWHSPHPSVGVFDIDDLKQLNLTYSSGTKKLKPLELSSIQDELKSLQHLTKIDPILLEQNKNRCCTFKMISQDPSSLNQRK